MPLEDLPQPVLELLRPTISLESSRERTAVAAGSFELKLLQRQYPLRRGVGGNCGRLSSPVRQLITELVILANQVIAAHLQALGIPAITGTTGSGSGGCPGDDQLVSNLGVELR